MEFMIAYCGLVCDSCPIHLATLEKNQAKRCTRRELIAIQCSKLYGMKLQLKDITDCDGCRTNTGRLFSGSSKCEIRKCASLKNIRNCAYCHAYACGMLKNLFSQDPGAQDRLEEIRNRTKK